MLQNFKVLPKLIVFDLDYTLWPFWCDTHIYPPIHKRDDTLYNADGTKINIYPDSELILKCIHSNPGLKLACASSNTDQLVLTALSTAKASNMLQNFKVLPKLIVFDLDYTLWPFWCDTHIYPPIHKRDDTLYNADGTKINIYPDSELILKCIHSNPGLKLACASRTGEINIAKQLLNLLGWDELFDYVVIFPGSKVMHFERLHKRTGIPYNQMVFFDDEHRNVSEVSRLGVHTHLVNHGVSLDTFKFALQQFETVSS
ncbi:magnesium-dependent phosphatase 1 isoform X1 [Fasciola gigantica]|uniref:Magnesium-dependent phosphatase 1 isoform X1 n=1 Tax=Fasciola gigantica TaxID=46835 RepID=A0A504Z661_FASGI|nr:magnesium-dependent phosphatase 1 isoform X1 [Fasciola gigantica]